MDEFEKTSRAMRPSERTGFSSKLLVTIFDGKAQPKTIVLDGLRQDIVTFGRNNTNDIVLTSRLVSREHGRFIFTNGLWKIEDRAIFGGKASENGLVYNNTSIVSKALNEGDFIRIDDCVETISEGVLFVFASPESANRWNVLRLDGRNGK